METITGKQFVGELPPDGDTEIFSSREEWLDAVKNSGWGGHIINEQEGFACDYYCEWCQSSTRVELCLYDKAEYDRNATLCEREFV